ncbi:MAG: hypothetical protein KJ916_15235 [Alphaproteobacteria bacterium]|nr:hypothetical protein [Alphaproteobacteria bacterium]
MIAGGAVKITERQAGKTFTLALTAKDASKFGAFVSEQLEALYAAFHETDKLKNGD